MCLVLRGGEEEGGCWSKGEDGERGACFLVGVFPLWKQELKEGGIDRRRRRRKRRKETKEGGEYKRD